MLNNRLLAALQTIPGIDGLRGVDVLQCSSANATGAIIYHLSSRIRRGIDVVVKTPRDPTADHSIAVEWDNVTALHGDERFGALLPTPLRRFEIDDATFYAYRRFVGVTMFSLFRNRLLGSRDRMRARFGRQALEAALRLHASHTRTVTGEALAQDLRLNMSMLRELGAVVPPAVAARATAAAEYLAASGIVLPVGRVHGDFSPYNLITETRSAAGCSGIIDWEHSESDRPQHLDIFRFIAGCELMGRRSFEGGPALLRMANPGNPVARELWRPWLARMEPAALEAATRAEALAALWMHYWICAAYREQRRHVNPADISQSTYLRGLHELTTG